MANNDDIYIDYQQVQVIAKEIEPLAYEFNDNMANIYKAVGEMHNHWNGEKYNEIVKSFNNLLQDLFKVIEAVVSIPNFIRNSGANWEGFDTCMNKNSGEALAKMINEIPLANDVVLKYEPGGIEAKCREIHGNLGKARAQINDIADKCSALIWTGQDKDLFMSEFNTLKGTVEGELMDLEKEFKGIMDGIELNRQKVLNANMGK